MTIKRCFLYVIIVSFVVMAMGCGRVETYGEKITNRNITSIKDIISNPKMYEGKAVTVKGKIALECETGCWFNLKEGNAVLYTDIAPSGLAIPQNVGRTATVEGKVSMEEGKLTLTGKGVELR